MKQKAKTTHESLRKALEILLSFTPTNQEKSVAELSREMGIHRSTISRILGVLVDHDFLLRNPFTKKYSLGKSTFYIGTAIYQTVREKMVIIAQPYIDDLRDSIGNDVGLELLFENRTILAYRAWGPNQFRTRYTMGDRLPAQIVAGGKAILAYSPTDFIEKMLKEEIIPLTPKTITDPDLIKQRLAEYKKNGFAYDLGESDLDCHFVAAPVFNFANRPIAAVVTGNFADQLQDGFDPKVLSALKETASKISARLMYMEDSDTTQTDKSKS